MVTAGLAAALTCLATNVSLFSALSTRWALAKLTSNNFSEVLLNHSKFVPQNDVLHCSHTVN